MDKFLNPEDILDELDLKPNMMVADFGCGSGGFTIPLAKVLDEGLVYGLDIQEQPLSALKGKVLLERLNNVRIIKCDLEPPKGSTLKEQSVDLVLIPNVLFQIKNKNAIILEASRILRDKGKLVIIDWLTNTKQGPEEGRIPKEEAVRLAKEHGFQFDKEFDAGKYHFGIVFTKP